MGDTLRWIRSAAAALLLAGAGCATHRESEVASSGDPEADQRANQRVGATSDGGANAKATEKTLFDRVGGMQGLAALVDDMVDRSINDPRVNFDRTNIRSSFLGRKYPAWETTPQNVQALKKHMVEFLALASGGPAEYTGRDVRDVHRGMRITNPEFDAMVGDVKASMDRLGWATREKRDLLAVIETTRKEIVEK
jgi:hemoglobin